MAQGRDLAGLRRAGRRSGAVPALVVAAALLLAGCGGQSVRDTAADDGKAPGPSGAAPHASVTPAAGVSVSPSAPVLPDETSTPDPSLPPPVVSMDIAHASDGGSRAVNITLDDGPDPTWTPKILKVLRDNGVRATFCMIGPQATAHPELVKQVVAAGHRLCDHSVHHDEAMDHKSQAYQKKEILDAAAQITQASGGVAPLYYRAPGGAFTPYSRQIAASRNLRPLGWNVDSDDWQRHGVAAIEATVKEELGNGPTLLFHDGGGDRSQTVQALKQLLPWLRQHGYRFGFPVH
jgi:peptidoglycan-N-acetylglucosamine deacetylase